MRVIWGPRQYIALKCFQLTFGTKEKWESSVSFPVLKQKRVNRGFFRARSTTSLKLPHHNSNCCSAILPSGPPQIIRPLEYAVSKQTGTFLLLLLFTLQTIFRQSTVVHMQLLIILLFLCFKCYWLKIKKEHLNYETCYLNSTYLSQSRGLFWCPNLFLSSVAIK